MKNSRAHPKWWDHQYYPLLRLSARIRQEIDRVLLPTHGDRIVDLGCGDMPYRSFFEQRGCIYVGCDLGSDAPVHIAPGCPVPLPDRSADGVVSFQVLEHVWDLEWYLGECLRLLRPSGWLLLSTHGSWLYHPHPTDFRRWTADGLKKELEERGFEVGSITGLVGPLAWTTQFRLLGYREALRRIPLLGGALAGILASVMNLRMRLEDALTPPSIEQDHACMYVVVARPAPDHPA